MVRRERPLPARNTFDRRLWMRLGTLLVAMAVLALLILRLQDPDVAGAIGRLFAPEEEPGGGEKGDSPIFAPRKAGQSPGKAGQSPETAKAGKSAPPSAEAPKPQPDTEVPLGPTDEDQEEANAAQEEFQAITDGTLEIRPEEMFAYKRLLQWVLNQPASLLEKRATTDVTLNELMLSPGEHRGALVKLNLNARMIVEDKRNAPKAFGFPIYEIWGSTAESGVWLYDVAVVDLPQGLPVGRRIKQEVRVVGYFLKLQGYFPAKAKPGSRPEKAPLLVGRVLWAEPAARLEAADTNWSWVWGILGLFLVWIGVRVGLLLFRRPRRPRTVVTRSRRPGAMPIEDWFEQAAVGAAPEEPPTDEAPEPKSNGRTEEGNGLDGGRPRIDN